MGQTCIGLCERLKSPPARNNARYKLGQKRCSLCAHYFSTEEVRCPCCKTILRSKSRNRNRNSKLDE